MNKDTWISINYNHAFEWKHCFPHPELPSKSIHEKLMQTTSEIREYLKADTGGFLFCCYGQLGKWLKVVKISRLELFADT